MDYVILVMPSRKRGLRAPTFIDVYYFANIYSSVQSSCAVPLLIYTVDLCLAVKRFYAAMKTWFKITPSASSISVMEMHDREAV
jgi:hypothetical protein